MSRGRPKKSAPFGSIMLRFFPVPLQNSIRAQCSEFQLKSIRLFCVLNRAKTQMIRSLLSLCLRFFKSRIQLQLEIIFLRKQLEIVARTSPKLRIRHFDRLFFSTMTNLFGGWKNTLLILKPETVIRWHQQGFKLYWRWKSRHKSGRPQIPQEQINLIKQMARDNPLWGAPRIHGELLKLGFDISEATVLRFMPKKPRRTTGEQWKTFLLQSHFGL